MDEQGVAMCGPLLTHTGGNWRKKMENECCPTCGNDVYYHSSYCGVKVCDDCGYHEGLARCYCGWSISGEDGREELMEMGECLDPEDY